ncbi:hypothetical protein J7L13_02145 [bacterium]|nr:hypothetical protein [bacterium]
MSTKEKILSLIYYLGPWGIIAFFRPSSDFEKFHATEGLSLFVFFLFLIAWLWFSLWVVPVLSVISGIGFLAIFFWLGYAIYAVLKGKKLNLVGLEPISRFLRSVLEEI